MTGNCCASRGPLETVFESAHFIAEDVKNIAKGRADKAHEQDETKYIMKTRKIGMYKKLKQERLSLITEKNRKEFEERKKRHAEGFQKCKEEKVNKLLEYQRVIDGKQYRQRDIIAMRV